MHPATRFDGSVDDDHGIDKPILALLLVLFRYPCFGSFLAAKCIHQVISIQITQCNNVDHDGFLHTCGAHLHCGQWLRRGFDPPPHGWSDDHLNWRLHHLQKGEDGDLGVATLFGVAFVVVLERKIERNRVGLLFGEVCAVLLTVEDDEEHVSRSECAAPISAGGNTEWGIRSPGITPNTQNGMSSSKQLK